MRHLNTEDLFVQHLVYTKYLTVHKIGTLDNCADILTKCVPGNLLVKHMTPAGFEGAEAHKSQRGHL